MWFNRSARKRAPKTSGTLANKVRLAVEQLEDRLTPSTNSTVLLPAFYQALLNRQPDYPGALGYSDELTTGTPNTLTVAYQIETSPSNEYYTDLAQSYYVRFLHREASPAELQYFVNQLATGTSDEAVASQFLGSAEYYQGLRRQQSARLAQCRLPGLVSARLGRHAPQPVDRWHFTANTGPGVYVRHGQGIRHGPGQ